MPDFVYTRLDCFRYTDIDIRVKNKLLSFSKYYVILSKELFQYLFFKTNKKTIITSKEKSSERNKI